jgi:hypothetical protein
MRGYPDSDAGCNFIALTGKKTAETPAYDTSQDTDW